jgi:hypothetical protein
LYLEAGEIARAWPYFRALGDPAPVAAAIEASQPDPESADSVIEIALGEGVHPLRGLELVLAQHGTCRAITLFDQYPDEASREAGIGLLVDTLYGELKANLARAIEHHEGYAPSGSIPAMIAGRDWLFGEYDYYVDTSHLISILRYALDAANPATLAKAIEMARYGQKLAPMFQHRGDPPLDDVYADHRIWLQAVAGQDQDAAVAHFRAKVAALDLDQTGTYPAQVLVRFLLRLRRFAGAVDVFEAYLTETDPAYLSCPGLVELCRLAEDWPRLRELARRRGDAITFAAATLMSARPLSAPAAPKTDGH